MNYYSYLFMPKESLCEQFNGGLNIVPQENNENVSKVMNVLCNSISYSSVCRLHVNDMTLFTHNTIRNDFRNIGKFFSYV